MWVCCNCFTKITEAPSLFYLILRSRLDQAAWIKSRYVNVSFFTFGSTQTSECYNFIHDWVTCNQKPSFSRREVENVRISQSERFSQAPKHISMWVKCLTDNTHHSRTHHHSPDSCSCYSFDLFTFITINARHGDLVNCFPWILPSCDVFILCEGNGIKEGKRHLESSLRTKCRRKGRH